MPATLSTTTDVTLAAMNVKQIKAEIENFLNFPLESGGHRLRHIFLVNI